MEHRGGDTEVERRREAEEVAEPELQQAGGGRRGNEEGQGQTLPVESKNYPYRPLKSKLRF